LILTKEERDRLESLVRRANEDTQLRVRADCKIHRRNRSCKFFVTMP